MEAGTGDNALTFVLAAWGVFATEARFAGLFTA